MGTLWTIALKYSQQTDMQYRSTRPKLFEILVQYRYAALYSIDMQHCTVSIRDIFFLESEIIYCDLLRTVSATDVK